jgi:hypothetical protein
MSLTPDQRFTLLISSIGLVFLVLSAGLGLIIRITVKWTKVEDRLDNVSNSLAALVSDKDRVHRELADHMKADRQELTAQMAADRQATNDRLTWLERHLWSKEEKP